MAANRIAVRAKIAKAVKEHEAGTWLSDAAPALLAACRKQQDALTKCVRFLMGNGPQPDPAEMAEATSAGFKAIGLAMKRG